MNNETAAVLAILVTAVLAGIWYWSERVRRVPIEQFGLEAVNHVLGAEPDSRRTAILARGWMTSHEWTEMNRRQVKAIDAEMKRRGAADERENPLVSNESWVAHAYPLQQATIRLQGTRHSDKADIISQLETVLERLKAGDTSGHDHDDDFGYAFEYVKEVHGPSFFDEPHGAA